MTQATETKVFLKEIYPVKKKKILGLFDIEIIEKAMSFGKELVINTDDELLETIHIRTPKFYKKIELYKND